MFEMFGHVLPVFCATWPRRHRARHAYEGARFTIPTPALLAKVAIFWPKSDGGSRHQGRPLRIYLSKIASAGQNGSSHPRHIIALMVT